MEGVWWVRWRVAAGAQESVTEEIECGCVMWVSLMGRGKFLGWVLF